MIIKIYNKNYFFAANKNVFIEKITYTEKIDGREKQNFWGG